MRARLTCSRRSRSAAGRTQCAELAAHASSCEIVRRSGRGRARPARRSRRVCAARRSRRRPAWCGGGRRSARAPRPREPRHSRSRCCRASPAPAWSAPPPGWSPSPGSRGTGSIGSASSRSQLESRRADIATASALAARTRPADPARGRRRPRPRAAGDLPHARRRLDVREETAETAEIAEKIYLCVLCDLRGSFWT